MKAYSQDLRDRVIDLYLGSKYKITLISSLLKLDRHTVSEWIKRYKGNANYSSRQHIQKGRNARFTDKEKVINFLANNPDSQGIEIRDAVAPKLPMSTFYDTLNRMGITYKKRTKI